MIGTILLGAMVVLILMGMPVGFAIGIASTAAVAFGGYSLLVVPQKILAGMDSFPILAIPFFILAGNLMTGGGITDRILDFTRAAVGWMRGSLGIVTVAASAVFAAISGSGTATVTAIGGITIPAMKRDGYSPDLAAAIAGSASILGPIIPPSIVLIVYGNAVQASIRDLFLASALPGLILFLAFVLLVFFLARKHNLPVGDTFDARLVVRETRRGFLALLMPVVILVGIFGGIFTPTEAAVVSVVYALIVGGLVYRDISWKKLVPMVYDAAIISAVMLLVVGASKTSSWVLAMARIPEAISSVILSITDIPMLLLLVINIFLLVVGMFMEANVAVIIFTPILLPIAMACGLSTVQFGVMMCFNLCLGLLTPPLGLCALLANNIAETRLERTLRQCIPFFAVGLVVLMVTTFVPAVTLWLPDVMK